MFKKNFKKKFSAWLLWLNHSHLLWYPRGPLSPFWGPFVAANPQNVPAQTTVRLKPKKKKKKQATAGGIEEPGMAGSCLFSKREGQKLQREGKEDKTSIEIPYTELAGRWRGMEKKSKPDLIHFQPSRRIKRDSILKLIFPEFSGPKTM